MSGIIIDTESELVQERFALVATTRRQRKRFPAGCVHIVGSIEEAIAGADPNGKIYPAVVAGPSKSSENVAIYYLLRWLHDT